MKKILFGLVLITAVAHGQKSEVVIDSADTKQAIFGKSLSWVTKKWNSANDVIQMKDLESGTIIVKGGLASVPKSLGMPVKGMTTTTVTIRVKDGKAKIDFESTSFKWGIGTLWTTEDDRTMGQFIHWKEATLQEIDDMIADYKKALAAKDDF